jgi:hypothetical protein
MNADARRYLKSDSATEPHGITRKDIETPLTPRSIGGVNKRRSPLMVNLQPEAFALVQLYASSGNGALPTGSSWKQTGREPGESHMEATKDMPASAGE